MLFSIVSCKRNTPVFVERELITILSFVNFVCFAIGFKSFQI